VVFVLTIQSMTTQDFIDANLRGVPCREDRMAALTFGLVKAQREGFIVEFGVAGGQSLNHLCDLTDQTVYGFDSFEGLPQTWRPGFEKGAYAVRDMRTLRFALNAKIYKGLFVETLPRFLKDVPGSARFIHIDCDLKSSTLEALVAMRPRIVAGTIIHFAQLIGYDEFENHQLAAFHEFCEMTQRTFKYICYTSSGQVSIRFD
jgi:hypothetical protein